MNASSFEHVFGSRPQVQAAAPGRVNLLGEHTDYNDGYVLPTAIPQHTQVAMRRNGGAQFVLHAADLEARSSFPPGQRPEEGFARYVYGCLRNDSHQSRILVPG